MTPHLPLPQVAEIQAGVPTYPDAKAGVFILTVKNLTEDGRVLGSGEALKPKLKNIKRYFLKASDILLAARSTSLRCAMLDAEMGAVFFNSTLLRIRCNPALLNPEYLYAWLSHPVGRDAVAAVSRSGTAQMSLTVAGLKKLNVPVPPIDSQARLAELLSTARQAHSAAVTAAETRLSLAREIALHSLTDQH